MFTKIYYFCKRLGRRDQGAAAVEMVLVIPVFLVLIAGVVDFGYVFYTKQIMTAASREGARYGTKYHTNASGGHILPNALSPSITNYITSNYSSLLPSAPTVTPSGSGYTSGVAGDDLKVEVSLTYNWLMVGTFIPGLGSSINLNTSTTMKVE
jgi:Flp pilus assembly protein TadG